MSLFLLVMEGFSQTTSFSIEDWVKKLNAEKDPDNQNFYNINKTLHLSDSVVVNTALIELEKNLASATLFFKARFHCLKAIEQSRFNYPNNKPRIKQLLDIALNEAYQTQDTNLISFVSWRFGVQMYAYKEIELAATYCLKAVELNNDFFNQARGYTYSGKLGEILFHCREYEKSIFYSRLSIAKWSDTAKRDSFLPQLWNTIGQGYQELGMLDSALINYERSMLCANKTNATVWKAINSGFIGQVLFLQTKYEKAKPLLAYDYNINKDHDLNIAAYSLQWLARINLIQGKKDSALGQAKESLRLLEVSDPELLEKIDYRQHTYYTIADVYRSMGKTDSFYHYFQLYISLHDSLNRVIARSSIDIAEMRNDNEKKFHEIQLMQREKRTELLVRNFVIAGIIMLGIIGLLYLNRSRIKLRHKQEIANAEVFAAKEKLQLFTKNIIEKTSLIEKLEKQVSEKLSTNEQQEIIAALSHQTILTEADWEKFKTLYETIYPGFFSKLKTTITDITIAEQRMAALIRLHLTTRQMASLLGISANSVNKTKQRLRQRFNLPADGNVEEFIIKL